VGYEKGEEKMNRKVLLIIFSVLWLCCSLRAASFQGTGILSGGFPLAVSDDGLIVTGYRGPIAEAFLWTADGGMVSLGLPGHSQAHDISGNGLIVVGDCNPGAGTEAFRWSKSDGMTGLGILPGGTFSVANGTSHDGSVIVGHSTSSLGVQAFRWTESEGMSGIGDLAGGDFYSTANNISYDGSVIVGLSKSSLGKEAFRWAQSEGMLGLGDLAGGDFYSEAIDTSYDGSVIVGLSRSNLGREAFRWTQSEGMIGLGDLDGGGFLSIACAVSGDGSVIVGRSEGVNGDEAFYWTAEDEMINLKDMLENTYGLDLTNWALANAIALSGNGNIIVGYGTNPDGNREGWIASIPERTIEVALDIKPQSCPNPINLKSKGVLPVAILGRQDFDVATVDIASVRLEGVAPIRCSFEDVTTIATDANDCPCTTAGPDGYTDLTLKFRTTRVVEELISNGAQLIHGQEFAATLAGVLLDGTPIEGTDCLVVRGTVPSTLGAKMSDINRDGVVNLLDFNMIAGNWLQAASTGLRLESLWFGIGVKRNAIIMSRTKFETIPPDGDFIIRTNSTAKNSITLFPNTVIPGDIICGPGGDPDTVINTKKNSVVTGDTYAGEEELQFPDVIAPELPYIGSLPPPTSTDPNLIVLTASDRGVYDEIILGRGKKLHISDGQVVIHVAGNVRIHHGAELRILDNATVPSLDLYLSGDLQADNGSIVDTENHMVTGTRLKIYGTNTCNSIVFMNSSVSAAVYAPYADLEIRNGSAVYGSFTGNIFLMRNSGQFYFDTRLLDATID
jgi:probable HAF family extracellular repeat protein